MQETEGLLLGFPSLNHAVIYLRLLLLQEGGAELGLLCNSTIKVEMRCRLAYSTEK